MKIKCLNNTGVESSITIGKTYDVLEIYTPEAWIKNLPTYRITNDEQQICWYYQIRFTSRDNKS